MIQVVTILPATSHLTLLKPFAAPTPMIADEITCVVETGRCNSVAVKMTDADVKSAAKPLTGLILMMPVPTVLMIRQPPVAVPPPSRLLLPA